MKTILLLPFLALALLASTPAFASTGSGYVIEFTSYNTAYSTYGCTFKVGLLPSSTSGTSYYVKDSATGFAATCLAVMLAAEFDDDVTLTYSSAGGYRYVSGLTSEDSTSGIPYLWTDDGTGTSSADKCMVTVTTSGGTEDRYVDDSGEEQAIACATLALMHFKGSATSTFTVSSGEIMKVIGAY